MIKVCLIVLTITSAAANVLCQTSVQSAQFSAALETQLACKENPHAGKLLINMRDKRFISKPYTVVDTISYFRLRQPLTIWKFKPVAVFGFERGFEKFFSRGPGTLPPENIGILVRKPVAEVREELKRLGFDGLKVEEAEFDVNDPSNESDHRLTEISCSEKFKTSQE